jgi:hypothetical protein
MQVKPARNARPAVVFVNPRTPCLSTHYILHRVRVTGKCRQSRRPVIWITSHSLHSQTSQGFFEQRRIDHQAATLHFQVFGLVEGPEEA